MIDYNLRFSPLQRRSIMKKTTKLIAATLLLGTVAGGAVFISTGLSQAGLKDDRCWDRNSSLHRLRNSNCAAFGVVEPNNQERNSGGSSFSCGKGSKNVTAQVSPEVARMAD